MALLAPNIYILQYLRNTQQLTSAINDKATKFLTGGASQTFEILHDDAHRSSSRPLLATLVRSCSFPLTSCHGSNQVLNMSVV